MVKMIAQGLAIIFEMGAMSKLVDVKGFINN